MAAPIQPQQPQRDDQRKEEKREEQEKRLLEQELLDFDAYAFYEKIGAWSTLPIPKPYKRSIHVGLFRVKQVLWQPLPLTKIEERELRALSIVTGKVLALLRRVDEKGLECPYIHQVNKEVLEAAIYRCDQLKEASLKYLSTRGFFARLSQIFYRSHMLTSIKDIEFFKRRLESIAMICKHQEFTQDLLRIKREVTFRTGNVLKDPTPPAPVKNKPSFFKAPVPRPNISGVSQEPKKSELNKIPPK